VIFANQAAFQCCGPSLEYCVQVWCKLIRKWPRNTPISVTRYRYALSTNTHTSTQPDIRQESRFCLPHLHSTPPLGGSRRNIATSFGMEKLEWCGYPIVKKFRRYVYSFWRDPRTWQTDGQTDRRTPHADMPRLCIASRGKNCLLIWTGRTRHKQN